ncbi:hypothetical protein VTO42DRAFT_4821 [Malbranchea cinnamomea]
MLLKAVDLTTALRPSLVQDETLLFVQNDVGLYEGKYKIPNYQHGHAYLTSHRICYVDTKEPRKYSVAIDLRDVDRIEYQAGFLRSSAKIVLYPKSPKEGPGQSMGINSALTQPTRSPSPREPVGQGKGSVLSQGFSPARSRIATWICPICSFSNPVPANFDPVTVNSSTPVPPCLACGIKPPFTTILKAAISSAANRDMNNQSPSHPPLTDSSFAAQSDVTDPDTSSQSAAVGCPRCTFANHPSLSVCEMCGAPLKQPETLTRNRTAERAESPAPYVTGLKVANTDVVEYIKLSFRGGGEKVFYERLKSALIQRKWLLHGAPPVPRLSLPGPSQQSSRAQTGANDTSQAPYPVGVGIAGLERRGLEVRKNNEFVLGSAFEDLEALMASAKEVIALAEKFATESGMASDVNSTEANTVLSQSAAALGMTTTKDMLGSGTGSDDLYLSELSRNLAEYLTDDRKGILHKEGGIMSLIDLWAVFNRSRNGVELVSPSDFYKAAQLWEKLRLPVRLRQFKSGLLVVQRFDWSDEKTLQQLKNWLEELRSEPPGDAIPWDWGCYGKGVTAQEAAQRFGWSVGVATEELEMAEDRGVLCREEGIEGVRYWLNHIGTIGSEPDSVGSAEEQLAKLIL